MFWSLIFHLLVVVLMVLSLLVMGKAFHWFCQLLLIWYQILVVRYKTWNNVYWCLHQALFPTVWCSLPSIITATMSGIRDLFQKPLVRRRSDLDNMRQCEVHMTVPATPRKNCCRSWLAKFPTRSKRIDVISRITFPLVFALFNLTYWSTYLFRDEQEDQPA